MDTGISLRLIELGDLVKDSQELSQALATLAGSLNTAPVTLAASSKECVTVTAVLGRFKNFYQTCSTVPVCDFGILDDICNGPLHELSVGMSDLRTTSDRLGRNDGKDDVAKTQLTIVWNEPALKQTLRNLSASRSSMEFLLNCAISQFEHAEATRPRSARSRPKSSTTAATATTTLTLVNKSDQCLSPTSPTTTNAQSGVFRVSDLPGVRSALEELRPMPRTMYRPQPKMTNQLHDAIDRIDEAVVLDLLLRRVDPNAPRPTAALSPLQRAFDKKASSIATFLAIAGANLDEPLGNGETGLIRGIKCGFSDKFTALLCELGACIDATDSLGCSALHYAAALKVEDDTIAVLIHAGASINLRDNSGRTPLITAVQKLRLRSVDLLTEYDADMEVRGPNGGTALHLAIAKRHYMLAEILADRGARLDSPLREHTALTLAIGTGSSEIAEMLIEGGADVNLQTPTGNSPLISAAAIGDADITELLLAHNARVDVPNAAGYYPIHMASHKNRVEVLRLLVGAGSPVDSPSKQNETPLSIAVRFGYQEVVQHLILAGADLDHTTPGRDRAIYAALKSRNVELCLGLVQGGADSTSPSDDTNIIAPIHLAAELGLDHVVAAMIRAGADLETATWQGYTPLYFAAENGHVSTVRLLLKNGASVRSRSSSGGNIMFVSTAHPAILKQLTDLNMDVNERDLYGATALHYASLWGHAAGAKVLLQKGARVKHANSVFETMADFRAGTPYRQGTPAGLAKQKGHIQLARMIDQWKFKAVR